MFSLYDILMILVEDAGSWCWPMFFLFLASLVLFLLFDALVVVYVPSLSLSWRWWLKMLIDDDLWCVSLSLMPFSLCLFPLYLYLEDAGWRCWLMIIYDMCPCPWFPCPCASFLFILIDTWGNWSVKKLVRMALLIMLILLMILIMLIMLMHILMLIMLLILLILLIILFIVIIILHIILGNFVSLEWYLVIIRKFLVLYQINQ